MTVPGTIFDPGQTLIRVRFADGKYSCGGSYAHRSKAGKVWVGRGPFHNHLCLLTESVRPEFSMQNFLRYFSEYAEAVVVNETTKEEIPFTDYLQTYLETKGRAR